jgi:uncharacterized membrane protein
MQKEMNSKKLFLNVWANKSEIERLLILSTLFSLLLLFIRIAATERLVFLFLPWNLFLAFIPYAIVKWLMTKPGWIENRIRFILIFCIWLLFIPNSFYIITDLYHLELSKDSPRWFDLTLIFSFAWVGMLLGILAVNKMETIFRVFLNKRNIILFIYPVMWLIAWGIYIGRYLRFNSWDVITNPFSLFSDIIEMFSDPLKYTYAWGMIFCFSVFITLVYLSIKKISFSISENKFS